MQGLPKHASVLAQGLEAASCEGRRCAAQLQGQLAAAPGRLTEAQAGDMLHSPMSLNRVSWYITSPDEGSQGRVGAPLSQMKAAPPEPAAQPSPQMQNWALDWQAASPWRIPEAMQFSSRRQAVPPWLARLQPSFMPDAGSLFSLKPAQARIAARGYLEPAR